MRLKAPFYGFAIGAIAFLLPLVVFAALLPYLINADPVKKHFVEELRGWTGSEVTLAGPVAIESFFSLSLNAQNVEFERFQDYPDLKSVKAGRIVARIAWTDLLLGNLDFDKVKIYDAKIHLRETDRDKAVNALLALLTTPYQAPFEAFVLSNCQIEVGAPGEAEERLDIGSLVINLRRSDGRIRLNGRLAWLGEEAALDLVTYTLPTSGDDQSRPVRLDLDSRLLTADFRGKATPSGRWTADGEVQMSTPNADELSRWLGGGVATGVPGPVSVAGALALSSEQIQLQSGTISVGTAEATGELALGIAPDAMRLEGSLAFEQLDLSEFRSWGGSDVSDARAGDTPLTTLLRNASIDLRGSARRIVWDWLETGEAAFTLSGRSGVVSAEIARLDLFGGSLLGHVETSLRGETPVARARITAENIDAAQLLGAVSQPEWLTGQADANITAQMEGRSMNELARSMTADAQVAFPEGGQLRLDIPQLAKSASVQGQDGWQEAGSSWTDFSELRFKLALKDDRVQCLDLRLQSPDWTVHGHGDVDLDRRNLDWQLAVHPASGGAAVTDLGQDRNGMPEASLSIKGPWARPLIRLGRNSSSARQGLAPLPRKQLAGRGAHSLN